MPIRFVDLDGLEPGEPFGTKTDAALNFISIYGKMSIQENREFAASIYSYTDANGETRFTYNVPTRGSREGSSANPVRKKEGTQVAGVHTHSKFEPELVINGKDWNNTFSGTPNTKSPMLDDDISKSEDLNQPEIIGTPQGSAQEYDPITNQINIISTKAPSDPDDPSHLNDNFAVPEKKEDRKSPKEYKQENKKIRKEYEKQYKEKLKARKN